MAVEWADMTMTIGGVPFDGVTEISYSRERDAADRRDFTRTASASFEVTLEPGAAERLMFALTPNQRGVTWFTLFKRSTYGGRKGRRAAVRLRRILDEAGL